MKFKLFTLLVFVILLSSYSFAQTQIKLQADVGGNKDDILKNICMSADGILAAGYSSSGHSMYKTQKSRGATDYWVIKFVKDKVTGKPIEQWDRTIGGDTTDDLVAARSTRDGGYILAGNSLSGISGDKTVDSIGSWDIWLVKLDADGNIAWQKVIGTSGYDVVNGMDTTNDGGFILIGSGGLTKTDEHGNVQWVNNATAGYSTVEQTIDNGYVLTTWNGMIAKTDNNGNILWSHHYGIFPAGSNYTAQGTKDSGFILCGVYASDESPSDGGYYNFGLVVHKLDKLGNVQWSYSVTGMDFSPTFDISLLQTKDGGYLIGSTAYPHNETWSYYALKLGNTGVEQWSKTINTISGFDIYSRLMDLKEPLPNFYALGGISSAGIGRDKTKKNLGGLDYWIIGLKDTTVNTISVKNIAVSEALTGNRHFVVYPNPANDILHVDVNAEADIVLINQNGKIILSQTIKNKGTINTSRLPAGLYYIKNTITGEVQKVMITR